MNLRTAALTVLGLLMLASACTEKEYPERMTVEQLQNPESCMSCHPTHYREWKASMHAYASDDPVFVAMNKLGQEETNGELGDFCVKCHAPLATQLGLTDGSPESVENLPDHMKGVTCYFCHNVESVDGENNAQITLANDTVMRGSIVAPTAPTAHGVQFSRFMNRYDPSSSQLCGGCHDIELKNGVHLERTFAEYNESIFAGDNGFLSCSGCHMLNRQGLAAQDPSRNVRVRQVHSHLWPAVDTAITPWPDRELYEDAVQCAIDGVARVIEVDQAGPGRIKYVIETNAGHKMPSGASQDRRLWVEMIAFDANGGIHCSNGVVADDEAVVGALEPNLFCEASSNPGADSYVGDDGRVVFRDRIFDDEGDETHMFWRAASIESTQLPQATAFMPDGTLVPHVAEVQYELPPEVRRVTLRLKMRPMDHDVLGELVDAGVLDPELLDEIPTYTVASASAELVLDEVTGVFEGRFTPERLDDCFDKQFCAFDADAPMCED